jgi:hypothetical protein
MQLAENNGREEEGGGVDEPKALIYCRVGFARQA